MVPFDIVKILTAAAPIAASVASIVKDEKKEPEIIERKEPPVNNITISITNNFYSNSNQDSMKIASDIEQQVLRALSSSGPRYII